MCPYYTNTVKWDKAKFSVQHAKPRYYIVTVDTNLREMCDPLFDHSTVQHISDWVAPFPVVSIPFLLP